MAVWWLETSRHREPEDLPCRRTELEEGDVILHELPKHVKVRTGRCRSASWEFSSPGYSQLLPSYQRTETITDRLRPVTLWEPPYADPHVRWCGGWGGEPPGYPIRFSISFADTSNRSPVITPTKSYLLIHEPRQVDIK